jgi:DUF1016 N-terminal domain
MTGVMDPRQREPEEAGFTEIVRLIGASRERAMQAVNTALIELYWQIGEVISRRVAAAQWGESTVDQLASYIARWEPGIRGFSRSNLLRMRQFYELTGTIKLSHRWCDKSLGHTIFRFWVNANCLRNASSTFA